MDKIREKAFIATLIYALLYFILNFGFRLLMNILAIVASGM